MSSCTLEDLDSKPYLFEDPEKPRKILRGDTPEDVTLFFKILRSTDLSSLVLYDLRFFDFNANHPSYGGFLQTVVDSAMYTRTWDEFKSYLILLGVAIRLGGDPLRVSRQHNRFHYHSINCSVAGDSSHPVIFVSTINLLNAMREIYTRARADSCLRQTHILNELVLTQHFIRNQTTVSNFVKVPKYMANIFMEGLKNEVHGDVKMSLPVETKKTREHPMVGGYQISKTYNSEILFRQHDLEKRIANLQRFVTAKRKRRPGNFRLPEEDLMRLIDTADLIRAIDLRREKNFSRAALVGCIDRKAQDIQFLAKLLETPGDNENEEEEVREILLISKKFFKHTSIYLELGLRHQSRIGFTQYDGTVCRVFRSLLSTGLLPDGRELTKISSRESFLFLQVLEMVNDFDCKKLRKALVEVLIKNMTDGTVLYCLCRAILSQVMSLLEACEKHIMFSLRIRRSYLQELFQPPIQDLLKKIYERNELK